MDLSPIYIMSHKNADQDIDENQDGVMWKDVSSACTDGHGGEIWNTSYMYIVSMARVARFIQRDHRA